MSTNQNNPTTEDNIFVVSSQVEGGRTLQHSAQLVGHCDVEARRIVSELTKTEGCKEVVVESFNETDAMDKLLVDFKADVTTGTVDTAEEPELVKLLASQQSKRSRTRGKEMTVPNYLALISASIAEQIIRLKLDKPKGSTSAGSSATEPFTEAQLETYGADLALATKRVRSLQSWKSTHKHLENTAEWKIVCKNIESLVALRPASTTIKVIKPDPRYDAIRAELKDVDITKLSAKDKAALLEQIHSMIAQ